MKSRIVMIRLLVGLSALLSTGTVLSHNPLNDPDWCEGIGVAVVVEEFEWSGLEIDASENGPICSSGPRNATPPDQDCEIIPPTHGQFDDDWRWVFTKANQFCQQFSVSYPEGWHPDHGTVVSIPLGPDEFIDDSGHHELYESELGVMGACVRCVPLPDAPRPGDDPLIVNDPVDPAGN